ncbi:hypothetical protein LR48_Vigan11g071900 [Vigna angularis]|uniref:Uncharacterized protein n=1 Tax=Phaseolus angularis TaxID=3914 RepID=A0A0L9VRH9_PHAAN|nr:hypothetical protein LR48_Vigan11g071900 [Vigna angularis]
MSRSWNLKRTKRAPEEKVVEGPPPTRHELWKATQTKSNGQMTSQSTEEISQRIDELVEQHTQGTFVAQEEEKKEIKEKIVQQDLKCEDEEFKPGKPVKHKNKLWAVKEIKVNGVIEIEAPYSRRVKNVDKKMLKTSSCDESKRNTNIKASN